MTLGELSDLLKELHKQEQRVFDAEQVTHYTTGNEDTKTMRQAAFVLAKSKLAVLRNREIE